MKQTSAAADRNKEPILEVLRSRLPARGGLMLEVASGTGQHAVHLGAALPAWTIQPSDVDAAALASIRAWRAEAGLPNVAEPLELDVTRFPWPIPRADAVFCANMIHIAPWDATLSLLHGAARLLAPGGLLIMYGPYFRAGVATAESNVAFDADLRARNPAWGVRHVESVAHEAAARGLALLEAHPMPANNLVVLYERTPDET